MVHGVHRSVSDNIYTMRMTFKFDVVTLIGLIESKPCLWDKNDEDYKNKLLRDSAWKEIFEYMEDGYENMTREEKKKTSEAIIMKWTNIRDAFIKSLRSKAKKRYMYSDYLQFLIKNSDKYDTIEEGESREQTENLQDESDKLSSLMEVPLSSRLDLQRCKKDKEINLFLQTKKAVKSKRDPEPDPEEKEILGSLEEFKKLKSETKSHHEILLHSFLPYISDMSESEIMEWQVDALMKIQNIKNRRNAPPRRPPRVSSSSFAKSNCTCPAPAPTEFVSATFSKENSPADRDSRAAEPSYKPDYVP